VLYLFVYCTARKLAAKRTAMRTDKVSQKQPRVIQKNPALALNTFTGTSTVVPYGSKLGPTLTLNTLCGTSTIQYGAGTTWQGAPPSMNDYRRTAASANISSEVASASSNFSRITEALANSSFARARHNLVGTTPHINANYSHIPWTSFVHRYLSAN